MTMPLEGIRILDWTIFQQGPVATMMLGDLGAEVIKLEERVGGDPGRGVMQIAGSQTGGDKRNYYFEANNRHKKSVTLDLKKPEAKEIVYRLVEKSDVFVQNFRKGVAAKLGLDYQTLSRYNPKLIYASATGYGPKGPDSGEPSFDYMGLARSGIMLAVGEPDMEPMNITGGIADQMGAIMLAHGIVVALLARERLGIGQEVDTSHLGSMATALQGLNLACRLTLGKEFKRFYRTKAVNPLWNHYKCQDDKWICFAMPQADRYWSDFCKTLGIQELEQDPRFVTMRARGKNAEELIAMLDKIFAAKPRDQWMQILKAGGDFIYTIVNSMNDLPEDQQMLANDYIVNYDHPAWGPTQIVGSPVIFSKTPANPKAPAPEFGEHTEQILIDMLGYSWEDVARLKEEEVI